MSGKVATAKLLLTDESRALLWQKQLERILPLPDVPEEKRKIYSLRKA